MSRKVYNKLIRDKIPQIIEKQGNFAKTSLLNEEQYRVELKKKVLEEAQELLQAVSVEEIENELADLEELVQTVAHNYGVTLERLEEVRIKKQSDRGGFQSRLFLEYVDEQKDSFSEG